MKKFSDFYIKFHRLFTFLGYGESQCMNNLHDKISFHLQAVLFTQIIQSTSLTAMKNYLIQLNNEQHTARAIKNQKEVTALTREVNCSKMTK